MPVGTNATVKALSPDDIRDDGRLDHPRQHVPPVPAARPRADRAARRAAPVHGLGRPDPDRFGRLPGRLAGRPAGRRRGRRDVPQPPRRVDPPVHARSSRSSVQEALGSDIAVAFDQPVFPSSTAGRRRRRDRADPSLGRALAGGPHAAPTRRCSGSSRAASSRTCGPRRRGSSRPCRSTASASAAWPATRRRPSATRRSTSPSRCSTDDPRPRYLMGLGSPADLLEAVHRGVDLFDSVLPARVARNGQLWVPGGRLNIRNQRFLDDPAPIQDDCPCLALPALLAGLSGPSVPGQGAARLPARDLSQPDLHPRLHGQDPSRDPGRNLPCHDAGTAPSRGPGKRR